MDGFRTALLMVPVVLLTLPAAVQAQQDLGQAEAELAELQQRIEALQAERARDSGRRSRAEQALREVETAEQQARRALAAAERDVRTAAAEQQALVAQVRTEERRLEQERELLGRQLRAAYTSGGGERLRVLLNQQDPLTLGRQMVYYDYLARARNAELEQVARAVTTLREARAAQEQQLADLRALEQTAAARVADIADRRAERAAVLADISTDITTRDAEIAQLNRQANELTELVAELTRALPALQLDNAEPFAGQAAQLTWPADGPLLKRFGQPRADGSLKWQGVLLGADPGAEVRAVYHGRVVFADWLAGMGLLTIVEHSDGYMSLYGHNQDLLKAVGAYVVPGEIIAHVGDSGGQASAGLYFEIRKDGEPVNPQRWIRE